MRFNLATTATLALGVMSLYVGLFAVFTVAAGVFIPPAHLGTNIGHGVGVLDYLKLAWLVASIAVVGGALGSLVERDEAVRDPAYRAHGDRRIEDGQLRARRSWRTARDRGAISRRRRP